MHFFLILLLSLRIRKYLDAYMYLANNILLTNQLINECLEIYPTPAMFHDHMSALTPYTTHSTPMLVQPIRFLNHKITLLRGA
jgi:hypothetical protein